jgi:hypothetical protein
MEAGREADHVSTTERARVPGSRRGAKEEEKEVEEQEPFWG